MSYTAELSSNESSLKVESVIIYQNNLYLKCFLNDIREFIDTASYCSNLSDRVTIKYLLNGITQNNNKCRLSQRWEGSDNRVLGNDNSMLRSDNNMLRSDNRVLGKGMCSKLPLLWPDVGNFCNSVYVQRLKAYVISNRPWHIIEVISTMA